MRNIKNMVFDIFLSEWEKVIIALVFFHGNGRRKNPMFENLMIFSPSINMFCVR